MVFGLRESIVKRIKADQAARLSGKKQPVGPPERPKEMKLQWCARRVADWLRDFATVRQLGGTVLRASKEKRAGSVIVAFVVHIERRREEMPKP